MILAHVPVGFVWTGLFHVGSKYEKNFRGARSRKQGSSCASSILSPFHRGDCLVSDNLQIITNIKILLFTKHPPHSWPCGEQLLLQLVTRTLCMYWTMSWGGLNEKTLAETPRGGRGLRQVRKKCRLECCVSFLGRRGLSPWATSLARGRRAVPPRAAGGAPRGDGAQVPSGPVPMTTTEPVGDGSAPQSLRAGQSASESSH